MSRELCGVYSDSYNREIVKYRKVKRSKVGQNGEKFIAASLPCDINFVAAFIAAWNTACVLTLGSLFRDTLYIVYNVPRDK